MQEENISLYYKDAGSDKEYHVQLEAQDGGYVVLAQYGKRGGTLKSIAKTAAPVEYSVAKDAYDALLKRQLGKGYTPGEGGSKFVGTSLEERFTGIVPMLLNSIDEEQAQRLLDDDEWVVENKEDGHRRLTQRTAEQLLGINRKGLVTGLPEEVALELAFLDVNAPFILDGELVGSEYIIFDVLEWRGASTRELPLDDRYVLRDEVAALLKAGGAEAVRVSYTARTTAQKRRLYEEVRAAEHEGLVFKRRSSANVPGRPNSGGNQLKRKFLHSASVVVDSRHPTKRSIGVVVLDADYKKVSIGNVTIPSNYDMPVVGAIVEVLYQNIIEGGSLYQPQYKGVRDDLDAMNDCLLTQLHYKPAGTLNAGEEDDA